MAIRPGAIVANVRRLFLVIGVSALCGVLLAGLVLPVVASLGLGAREGANAFADMPAELETPPLYQRSRVTDASGATLATFYDENRIYVGLDAIAPVMRDAILSIEDDRFYERGPIDIQGTLRALMQNVEAGATQGGGSTLTQQYVKLVRVSLAETDEEKAAVQASSGVEGYRRKLEELRMAVGIEQEFSKDQILERYLNIAYFGSGAHGIEAAARTYFSTTAAELTIPQAAMLAGLVQAPYQHDPTKNPESALARRNLVLSRMAETGRLSEADAAANRALELGLAITPTPNGCTTAWAGYFCDYMVHEIRTMPELGETPKEREDKLRQGGLTITTTLDRNAQQAAQNAVSDRIAPTDGAIGSLATVQPGTGYIQAMANSRTYGVEGAGVSSINYAADWAMGGGNGIQPGSSFKPFVLAAAIKQGIGLNTSINSPQTLSMGGKKFKTCNGTFTAERGWNPKNSTGSGTFNLRTGTERSVNTFFIQLTQRTGICEPATIAQDSGVHRAAAGQTDSDGDIVPPELLQVGSFALGVNEVSPLSMAEAYATFAYRGVHCKSTSILTITDSEGNVLVDNTKPECNRVLEQPVADAVNSVLQGVIHNSGGTGGKMKLADGRIAGGKTGTTNGAVAVWFVGYTPQLATAVAVADVDGRLTTLDGREYNGERIGEACGGCIPGPIWTAMMNGAHDGKPKENFAAPDSKTVKGVTVKVPDVRGMSQTEAVDRLEGEGFTASVVGEVASDLAQGVVVRSDPGAGSDVGSGSNIGLYISNGTPPPRDDDDGGDGGDGDDDDDWDGDDDIDIDVPDPPGRPPNDNDGRGNGTGNGGGGGASNDGGWLG